MKYSKFTYKLLLAISLGIIDVAINIFETGYLMGKKPEFRWNYPRFQGMEKSDLVKKLFSLNKQGLIEKIEDKYFLTKRGKVRFTELDIYFSLDLPKNKAWGGIWYLIMFDIPENSKNDRDRLRKILTNTGLIRIQKSVYVYPHHLDKEFNQIQSLFPEKHLIIIDSKSDNITKLVYSRFKENKIII